MSDAESGDEYMEADSGEEAEEEQTQGSGRSDDDEAFPDEGIGGGSLGGEEAERFHFEILEPEKIVTHMAAVIRQVAEVSELPPAKCRILLHYYKWNVDRAVESYYSGDSKEVLRKAQGCPAGPSSSRSFASAPLAKKAPRPTGGRCDCDICCELVSASAMAGLDCGDRFCESCWRAYLRQKVMEEGISLSISCPSTACTMVVEDDLVMRLLASDAPAKRRYQQLITNSFVEANKLLRWCPSPSSECGRAVKAAHFEVAAVLCRCGASFCFGCGEEWHEPVQCHLLRRWIKKCNDDSETSNWIAANTKECPKCHVTIEKDGGCNHMTCRSTICKHEFCWVCQGPWEPHGSSWYACNRFDDGSGKEARSQQEKSRQMLLRYLHYCNRYMNHQQSLKLEHKLYARIKGKMEEMQAAAMSWIEVQYLKTAVDSLCLARRTLMYTYVFAFYLKQNNQSTIFEDNQGDLEMATEQLSEYLERDLEKENLVDLKQKVQDKSRYCEQRRSALLAHCSEGMENGLWEFVEM